MNTKAKTHPQKAKAVGANTVVAQEKPSKTTAEATPSTDKKPRQPKKTKVARDVRCTFSLPGSEFDAMQDLRHKLSDAIGRKVKKSQLLNVAARLLLRQTHGKIKAELAKVAAES